MNGALKEFGIEFRFSEEWSHHLYLNEQLWSFFSSVFHSLSPSKGDLDQRAQLKEPANILIWNTTRSDTAEYRCEVAAIDDQRDFDEILISLAVRGTVRFYLATRNYMKFWLVHEEFKLKSTSKFTKIWTEMWSDAV